MQINIKTSAANQVVVSNLTQKLLGGVKENIIARVALGYSLSLGKRFQQNEFNSYDSQGKNIRTTSFLILLIVIFILHSFVKRMALTKIMS